MSPLLHGVGAEIRADQHTVQYTKANAVLFLSEHLILLTVTEVIEEERTLQTEVSVSTEHQTMSV